MNQDERQKVRRKKKYNQFNWTRIAWIVVVFLSVCAIKQGYDYYELQQNKQQLEQQLEALQQENQKLEEERDRLKDPKELEQVAREELGLVKPGEVPYVK